MSLSAEALAQLEGLDLQEVRGGLAFVPTGGSREPLGADLSAEELSSLRSWDLSGVMARLNGLTFEPPPAPMPETETGVVLPPDGGVRAPTDEDQLPDWLKPTEEAAPPAETESQLPADGEQSQWESLSNDEKNAAMTKAFSDWRDDGVEPPEWMKNNLNRYGFWGGGEAPRASLSGPTAEEAAAGLAAVVEPGTQVLREGEVIIPPATAEKKRWDNIKKGLSSYLETHWKEMAERGVGIAVGAVLGKVAEGSPWVQSGLGMALVGTSVRSRLMDSSGRMGRSIEFRKNLYPEFYQSKNRVKRAISLVVEAEMRILQGSFWLLERPAIEGIGWGLVLQGVADGLTPDKPAEQPAGEGEGGAGLDEVDRAIGRQPAGGGEAGVGGQLPAEQVGPQHPGVGRLPEGGGVAMIPPEERLGLPGDAEVLAQQAAAQAEAARIAALQQGPTVAELAANMPKQTISEAIYQMIGDVPHRGEVTNVLFRAIGDKVNNLNEGAIKAAAEALRPIFDNIDQVVAGSGVPYTEGGRAAVEAMRGFNSPEAQAIRAGNMGDLEAAGNLLNNVIGPVIK